MKKKLEWKYDTDQGTPIFIIMRDKDGGIKYIHITKPKPKVCKIKKS